MLGPYRGDARGIGFNRATWNAGNRIGRAARPYVKTLVQKAKSAWRKSRDKAGAAQQKYRESRSTAANGVQVSAGGGGESKDHFRFGKRKSLKGSAFKATGVSTNVRADALSASAAQGQQNVASLGSFMDGADLRAIFTALGETTTAYNAAKVHLKDIHAEQLITNASSINVHAVIYDLMARHDGFTTVNPNPTTVFTLGMADAQSTAAANDYLIVGVTPWNNPRFRELYQILNQTKIILSPGQTHSHNVTYNINRIINQERYIGNTSGPIGGLSMYSMIVFHGTPVHDAATELVISTGLCKLDIVYKEQVTYQQIAVPNPFNSIVSSFATVTAPEQWVPNNPTDTADTT